MKHRWSAAFERAYQGITDPLDLRAVRVCESWIIWADAFACRPDNALIERFVTAQTASQPEIARMITLKFTASCPVQLPMQLPTVLVMLMDDDNTGIAKNLDIEIVRVSGGHDPFDLSNGPRHF